MQALVIQNQPKIETLEIDKIYNEKTGKYYLELENLWLENIPFDEISAKEMLELMLNKPEENIGASFSTDFGKYQRGVCLKGIKEEFTSLADLKTFTELLDNFFGLSMINQLIVPDLTSSATVSGNITITGSVTYSQLLEICDWDEEEASWRLKAYKDVFVKAPNTTCQVTFDFANGEESLTWTIDQYTQIENPKIPLKPSIQSHFYTFTHWEDEEGNYWTGEDLLTVTKNIRFTAKYSETLQRYTVTFDSNSELIPVIPTAMTVDYGSTISAPTIVEEKIPAGVAFIGWFKPNGDL